MNAEQARKLSQESRETVSMLLLNAILDTVRGAAEEGKEGAIYRLGKAYPEAVVTRVKDALAKKGFVVTHVKPGSAIAEHGGFNIGWAA